MGYFWFKETEEFLRRVYPHEEIDLSLPVEVIILSQQFPAETSSLIDQVCKIPIELYRYQLFGSKDDPDIFVENIRRPQGSDIDKKEDLDALRKELGIEAADLSDYDIREFQSVFA